MVTSRRLTAKGEATRARLIELAADVFAEEGYAGVSIRDIANRSGLSSGAIYGTFRGKAELLAEAVEFVIATDVEALPQTVIEQTLPQIDAYQFAQPKQRERTRALLLEAAVAARTDRDVQRRVRETMMPHIEMATEAHEEWRERAGVDARVDMRALVMLLWSADLGMAVLEALDIGPPDGAAWADLLRRLLTSLEAPGAKPGAPSARAPKRRRS
jgi:AcrR family transcriptional regulator